MPCSVAKKLHNGVTMNETNTKTPDLEFTTFIYPETPEGGDEEVEVTVQANMDDEPDTFEIVGIKELNGTREWQIEDLPEPDRYTLNARTWDEIVRQAEDAALNLWAD